MNDHEETTRPESMFDLASALSHCIDCGVEVAEQQQNDSGWKVAGYSLCKKCDALRKYTETGDACLEHFKNTRSSNA